MSRSADLSDDLALMQGIDRPEEIDSPGGVAEVVKWMVWQMAFRSLRCQHPEDEIDDRSALQSGARSGRESCGIDLLAGRLLEVPQVAVQRVSS